MWVGLLLLFTSLGLQAQEQGAERFNVEEVKPPPTLRVELRVESLEFFLHLATKAPLRVERRVESPLLLLSLFTFHFALARSSARTAYK